ncbi:MAG: polymerase sigma factor RpoE [Myxococcaceae bacterium]|nr:polymerase sigma factor RpoE [Myxococcaceae bacterium]
MGPLDLDATYRQYFPLIREKCRRMLRDSEEAQDVAQDTFVRFFRAERLSDEPLARTAWLYRTATRLAIDSLRRRRPEGPAAPEPRAVDLEALLSSRQQLALLARRVPRQELELILLARFDGLTQAESAEVLGLSERTVRRRLGGFEQRLSRLQQEWSR